MEDGAALMEVGKYMGERENNNVIKKRDFESYEILLPFKALAGKRKKQFLCSELEKMHPCFSDEFAYDSSIHGIKKDGICEEVFVINKFKLAEYESKRQFAGSGFHIEDKKFHRFFVDKKWRFTLTAILGCVVVALAGSISGALAAAAAERNFVRDGAEISDRKEISGFPEEAEVKFCPPEISFFERLSASDGKITFFEWKTDGFTQRLKADLYGIFPENFFPEEGLSLGSLVYENTCPKMTVFYERPFKQTAFLEQENISFSDLSDFYKSMRNTLRDYGSLLKEENTSPYHIEFICKSFSEKEKLFEELAALISKNNFSVTAVKLRQTGMDEVSVGITLEKFPLSAAFDLKLIAQNLSLFIQNNKTDDTKIPALKTTLAIQKKEESASWKKLGEIKKSDKSSVLFYKNSEGKLEVVR